MNTIEFMSYLHSLDIKLFADGERLRCSAPKGVLTPNLQAELAEHKAEILTFLLKANLAARSTLAPIQPVSRETDLPLSFAQQRLWFLAQSESGGSTYNLLYAYRLTGHLNVKALEQSLGEIVQHHEILRTTFPAKDGQPVQVISPELTLTLPVLDLRKLSEPEREANSQLLITEEAQQPFALEQGPLLRVKLLRLAEVEHVLLMSVHHIVFDGWSLDVFFGELTSRYSSLSQGTQASKYSWPT